ncbi:arginine-tRNA-protein transferase [Clohesyomyces aquaticus]|uniref:arginyltransferase n=1 Tax=Clohesyomyces aquaticus TaxID=1231657 RepID=A0A1Y1YMN2_9PLEO|nr:arginine-tRNA-protein transferase [Clohesyomyces aquaticus]
MQSLVRPLGYSAESCGYCKDSDTGQRTPNSRCCYYISSGSMSAEIYQALVDRGWRRSGTIFYKPDVLRHCCPHYTIRLPVSSFKASKQHRHSLHRWNRYVLGDEYIKEAARSHPKTKKEARAKNEFDLIKTVHESQFSYLPRPPPEPAHRFEVTLETDEFTTEKFELYKNYQQNVHHEKLSEISANGFRRFLCNSPLERTSRHVDGKSQRLGSYHQCYRFDGRLIAMGVLDLLPHCVSGVYLLYHSDFEPWSLGKISAMTEAALALEGGYQFYYMGYYIHSCTKMRYKGDYKPSYILDPETYEWNPLDGELRELLDKQTYVSLSREHRLKTESSSSTTDGDGGKDGSAVPLPFPIPTAAEAGKAVQNNLSLFDLQVPGLMTSEEIEQQQLLKQMKVKIRSLNRVVPAGVLQGFQDGEYDMNDPATLAGIMGELIAALGPGAAKAVVVDFG